MATATDKEKILIDQFVKQGVALVPGLQVAFVRHTEEAGGTPALLAGVQLPAGLSANTPQVFALHDLCERITTEEGLVFGMSTARMPRDAKDTIDLAFLPADLLAPPSSTTPSEGSNKIRVAMIAAAVLILLILVAGLIDRQKPGNKIEANGPKTEDSQPKVAEEAPPREQDELGSTAPPSTAQRPAQQDQFSQGPGVSSELTSRPPDYNDRGSQSGYSPLPEGQNFRGKYATTGEKMSLSSFTLNESKARQRAYDDLRTYAEILETNGNQYKLRRVKFLLQHLP